MFENEIFEFHKNAYYGKELNEHKNYYINKAQEAQKLAKGNKQERKIALGILKDLKNKLNKEWKYFTSKVYTDYINCVPEANNYATDINDAYIHIMDSNKYANLESNLYDIYDYIDSYHVFSDNKLYGNTYAKEARELRSNTNNQDKKDILNIIINFYNKPSKKMFKEVQQAYGEIEKNNYKNLLNKDFLKKFS